MSLDRPNSAKYDAKQYWGNCPQNKPERSDASGFLLAVSPLAGDDHVAVPYTSPRERGAYQGMYADGQQFIAARVSLHRFPCVPAHITMLMAIR
jgi:hypothetical protein